MNVFHIDHLNMTVRNFEESADWYGRVFGFEVVERGVQDGQPWGVIKRGDAMLCIYEQGDFAFVAPSQRMKQKHHGFWHFALKIDDREEWLKRVEQENLEVQYGGAIDWPHSTSWYVSDPTGYQIEVVLWDENRPRFT
ncbi:MAG: VOC family protein [Myxococcales bacterium]|nr:VOC family protein [Myxococcales bacterium]